jgi:uncharacterized protein YhaN
MYHDDRLRQHRLELLRLYAAMAAAYKHLRHAEELEQQAMALLKQAQAYHHRLRGSEHSYTCHTANL